MTSPTGRIIKKGRLTESTVTSIASAGPSGAHRPVAATEDKEPEIVLHRDGDQIRAVEVTCGCGRTVVLECTYPEESAS